MSKYGGPVLCLSGILLALTAAAKPPLVAGQWPDTLPYALGGLALALPGLFWWRRSATPLWGETGQAEEESGPVAGEGGGLEGCVAALQALEERLPSLTLPEIADRLEEINTAWVVPLSRRHPSAPGPRFAQGELWINRARSAAGDRHLAETRRALRWALESLAAIPPAVTPVTGTASRTDRAVGPPVNPSCP
ncbi:MAG: hypothetical protein H7837_04615 [Magnetococcus sp. MYC-9]